MFRLLSQYIKLIELFVIHNTHPLDTISMKTKNVDEVNIDYTSKEGIDSGLNDTNNDVVTAPPVVETATFLPKFTSQSCSDLFEDDSVGDGTDVNNKVTGKDN